MTFEYGNASVTLPEVDWGEETTEEIEEAVYTFEEAYNLYSEYVMSRILYSLDEDIVSASVTVNNEAVLNEVIIGETSHAVYSPDQEVYTFIKDNQRYYASRDGEIKYYLIDDGEYNFNHSLFMFYVNLLVDNEGIVSIALSVSGTKTTTEFSTVFDGTVTVLIAYEGDSGMIATVSIVNGKVVSVNTVYSDTYEQYPTSVSIGYGNSIIVLPDLTDWYNASGPAVESEWYVTGVVSGAEVEDMPMYFDYITGCYKTENVDIVMGDKIIVKNKNDDSIKYEQIVDEDYLVGNASIVFDTRYETISFESDAFED